MAFLARDTSVAGASSTPSPASEREAELYRAEQAMRAAELQLGSESERVAHEAGALTDRARALEQEAGGLEDDPEVSAVLLRIREPAPVPAMAKHVERAIVARTEALELRRKAAEAIRTGLRACGEVLAARSRDLAADAQVLSRARAAAAQAASVARADAAAAAAHAASQARADALAAAASVVRVPPPVPSEALEAEEAPSGGRRGSAAQRAAPPPGAPIGKIALKRVAARVAMQTQVDLASDSNFFTGFSTNISEGGLFIATVNVLPPGTPVDVTFSLPAGARLTVKGEVRWTREVNDRTPEVFPGVGVRFTEVDPAVVSQIKSFVQEREPLFFPD
jgi:uncharacterized protein (TIGR02266 family)